MTDKKLTDSEIVKALRSWLEEIRKARQEYLEKVNEEHYPSMRYEYLLSDTINEINRLQTENDNLKDILYDADGVNLVNYWHQQCKIAENGCKNFGEENKNLKAEIERLEKGSLKEAMIFNSKTISNIKAEAYKEFAEKAVERVEKAKEKYQRLCKEQGEEMEEHMHIHFNGIIGIINNLSKELVGDSQ